MEFFITTNLSRMSRVGSLANVIDLKLVVSSKSMGNLKSNLKIPQNNIRSITN